VQDRHLHKNVGWKAGFCAKPSRFVERMLAVIETCRADRNIFAWLTETVRAHFRREATPPLVASPRSVPTW